MTWQISEKVEYKGLQFDISGMEGTGLFDPNDQGISPVAYSTACWNGCYCTYAIVDDFLHLRTATIGLNKDDATKANEGNGPRLFGQHHTVEGGHGFVYENLHEVIRFTGRLLLKPSSTHVHPSPCKDYELSFEHGRLVTILDRPSKRVPYANQVVQLRQSLKELEQMAQCVENAVILRRCIEESAFTIDDSQRSAIQTYFGNFVEDWVRLHAQNNEGSRSLPAVSDQEFATALRKHIGLVLNLGRGEETGNTCPECRGKKIIEENLCPTCLGTGLVYSDFWISGKLGARPKSPSG